MVTHRLCSVVWTHEPIDVVFSCGRLARLDHPQLSQELPVSKSLMYIPYNNCTPTLPLYFGFIPGHEVFAVLTHIDAYSPDEDSDAEEDEAADGVANVEGSHERSGEGYGKMEGNDAVGDGSGFDREADMPGIVSLW